MAKVTITVEDLPNGQVSVILNSNPPIRLEKDEDETAKGLSNAQELAMLAVQVINEEYEGRLTYMNITDTAGQQRHVRPPQ